MAETFPDLLFDDLSAIKNPSFHLENQANMKDLSANIKKSNMYPKIYLSIKACKNFLKGQNTKEMPKLPTDRKIPPPKHGKSQQYTIFNQN